MQNNEKKVFAPELREAAEPDCDSDIRHASDAQVQKARETSAHETDPKDIAGESDAGTDIAKEIENAIDDENLGAKIESIGIGTDDDDDEPTLDTLDTLEEKNELALELVDAQKYAELKKLLEDLEPADIAQMLSEIPRDRIPFIFRVLPKELAAETFVEMDSDEEEILIEAFSDSELESVMSGMFIDDTVDVIEEMPANVVSRILRNIPPEKRRLVNEIMNYPDDSAGSIMTIEYISLTESMTVGDALKRIRRTGLKKETVYTCYITDISRRLKGVVTALDLMTAESEDILLSEIMETGVI